MYGKKQHPSTLGARRSTYRCAECCVVGDEGATRNGEKRNNSTAFSTHYLRGMFFSSLLSSIIPTTTMHSSYLEAVLAFDANAVEQHPLAADIKTRYGVFDEIVRLFVAGDWVAVTKQATITVVDVDVDVDGEQQPPSVLPIEWQLARSLIESIARVLLFAQTNWTGPCLSDAV
jgi:hypothetical protein